MLKYPVPENQFDDLVPKRNKLAASRHKREVFWQITFPLIVLLLLTIVIGYLVTVSTSTAGETGVWRDISLLWMLTIGMIVALIPLAILGGLVYGLVALIRVLPVYTFKIQKGIDSVTGAIVRFADAIAAPVVAIGGFLASVARLFKRNA